MAFSRARSWFWVVKLSLDWRAEWSFWSLDSSFCSHKHRIHKIVNIRDQDLKQIIQKEVEELSGGQEDVEKLQRDRKALKRAVADLSVWLFLLVSHHHAISLMPLVSCT